MPTCVFTEAATDDDKFATAVLVEAATDDERLPMAVLVEAATDDERLPMAVLVDAPRSATAVLVEMAIDEDRLPTCVFTDAATDDDRFATAVLVEVAMEEESSWIDVFTAMKLLLVLADTSRIEVPRLVSAVWVFVLWVASDDERLPMAVVVELVIDAPSAATEAAALAASVFTEEATEDERLLIAVSVALATAKSCEPFTASVESAARAPGATLRRRASLPAEPKETPVAALPA